MKPEMEEKERIILSAGGNLLAFTGNFSAPTASVTTEKCVFNSVVSTPGARCLLADIKHFYLNNILPDPEFMLIPLKIIPQEIIDTYDINALVDDQGWIYMRTEKGMYWLKEAGVLAFNYVVKNLAPFGYYLVQHTPGLWKHKTRKTVFTLCVDDFGINYQLEQDG